MGVIVPFPERQEDDARPATVVVTGDRWWSEPRPIAAVVDRLWAMGYRRLAHGNARGLDRMAHEIARARGFQVQAYPAEWRRFGRAAGPIRNQVMLDRENPDLVVWFHRRLETSSGTRDTIRRAETAGIPVVAWTQVTDRIERRARAGRGRPGEDRSSTPAPPEV